MAIQARLFYTGAFTCFRQLLPTLFLLPVSASDPAPTSDEIGLGCPSAGWPVTFRDGSRGYADLCTHGATCFDRTRIACKNRFTIHDLSEIDRARSASAVKGRLFRTAQTRLTTIAVGCWIGAPPGNMPGPAEDIELAGWSGCAAYCGV